MLKGVTSMLDIDMMSRQAIEWAKEAGKISLERGKSSFQISFKSSPNDLVTAVDKEVETFLCEKILANYPNHGIVGEEGTFEEDPTQFETLWVIDPIDGTTNFVHQRLNYVISIAVVHKGKGVFGIVYDPTRDELFYGEAGRGAYLNGQKLQLNQSLQLQEALVCTSLFWNQKIEKFGLQDVICELPKRCRGIRVYGCAAMEMAYVAAGRVDAYVSLYLNPWDFAAGKIILEEAGGIVRTILGEDVPFDQKSTILASNSSLYPELISILKKV
jgi:myo-inositol-1(or 4)-monophosphatase